MLEFESKRLVRRCVASFRFCRCTVVNTPQRWLKTLLLSLIVSAPTAAFSDEFLARAALLNDELDMAWEIYSDLYDKGSPEAAFVLGMMYREGWGVEKDADRASNFLAEARERDHVEASYWLCRDQFDLASSRAEYDAVADLCMPAASQNSSTTTRGFVYHPHHIALAKYVAGKALLEAGSERTAFLCLSSAYIFIEGVDALRNEEIAIETLLARYSPKWYVGVVEQERPYEGRYMDTDKIPPCMISPIAAARVILSNGSPMMKGILSALELR